MQILLLVCLLGNAIFTSAQVDLGSAASYAVLAAGGIVNTGPTEVNGDIGVGGTTITGFPPGVFAGTKSLLATAALADATKAYNTIATMDGTTVLAGLLIDRFLAPGVYVITGEATFEGNLILEGTSNPNDAWYFQIGATLFTIPGFNVIMSNGLPCNVFWQVGGIVTLGIGTEFLGTILAEGSISAGSSVVSSGGLFSLTGTVALNSNIVDTAICAVQVTSSSSTSVSSTTSTSSTSSSSSSTISLESTTSDLLSTTSTSSSSTSPPTTSSSSSTSDSSSSSTSSSSFSLSTGSTTLSSSSSPTSGSSTSTPSGISSSSTTSTSSSSLQTASTSSNNSETSSTSSISSTSSLLTFSTFSNSTVTSTSSLITSSGQSSISISRTGSLTTPSSSTTSDGRSSTTPTSSLAITESNSKSQTTPPPASYATSSYTISTVYTTKIYTITSCAATVTDCPARIGQLTTETFSLTTIICPVSEVPVSAVLVSEVLVSGVSTAPGIAKVTNTPNTPTSVLSGHISITNTVPVGNATVVAAFAKSTPAASSSATPQTSIGGFQQVSTAGIFRPGFYGMLLEAYGLGMIIFAIIV